MASTGAQFSPGFIHLLHLTALNIRVCHALAFDFLAVTLMVPPSSDKSSLITALHSCLGKRLCGLTKAFRALLSVISPTAIILVHSACLLVGGLASYLRMGKGTSIPFGS